MKGRLGALAGSSWILGFVLAVLTWTVSFSGPGNGLDASWQYAIFAATHRGMHFGTDIVFTYGPLGFLDYPMLWYDNLAVAAFLYQSALYVLVSVTLVAALRRQIGLIAAALVGFFVLVTVPDADLALVLAAAWCLTALSDDPPSFAPWVVSIGGGVLGAVELLIEARDGPVIVLICAMTLLAVARRRLPVLLVLVGGVALAAWFATGQTISNLPDYVVNAIRIDSGYSEAMGVSGSTSLLVWAIIVSVGVVGWFVAALASGRPRRIAAGLVAAVVTFTLFKHGFVRADVFHASEFFASIALWGTLVRLPRTSVRLPMRVLAVAPVAVLALLNIVLFTGRQSSAFDPVTHLNTAVDQTKMLFSPRRREILRAVAGSFMAANYRLPAVDRTLLAGHTVHLDPWDTAAAWVYGLDWDPAPIFQGYSAYTSALDEKNANALSSLQGPQRILRENTRLVDTQHRPPGIDDRLGVWDPPAENLAMLCHFVAVNTERRWEVLSRVPDRCGPPRLLASVQAGESQTVSIPAPGTAEAVFGRVHGLSVAGLERIQTTLYRAHGRYAIVNGVLRIRIVPGTAQDGLLFGLDPRSDFPAPFALSPGVRRISFSGGPGSVRIDIYRMAVSRVPIRASAG